MRFKKGIRTEDGPRREETSLQKALILLHVMHICSPFGLSYLDANFEPR